MGMEGHIHGRAFPSFHILPNGSNLRLLVNLRVLPGGDKAAEIEQRDGALPTHQQ
jgi:hypothetical protein